MVGRFIGAYVLRLFSPGKVLACVAATVMLLLTVSANTVGRGVGLVAAGDRIVQLHHVPDHLSRWRAKGWGTRAAEGSGVICMAIVGGAIVPWSPATRRIYGV